MSKILIIDDNDQILEAMALLLERKGHHAVVRSTTADPVKEIAELTPDIVFLDLSLSGEDGKSVCAHLKTAPQTKNIPVILLSAHSESEVREAAEKSEADGYLLKPFDMETLLSLIDTHTAKHIDS